MRTNAAQCDGSRAVCWQADRLLDGYQTCILQLPLAVPAECEPDAPVTATLLRRNAPTHDRAVLYLHGWNDYFFQTHLADFFDQQGFDFYAVELRRYGRSLRPGQLPGFITDLDEYTQELDQALELIQADGHDLVTLMGHSTGGLIGLLWTEQRRGELNGVILNSPWLDLHGSMLLRAVTGPIIATLGSSYPTSVIPIPDNGIYGRSIHADADGEWHYEKSLKSSPDFAIRVGWLRAILQGHERIAKGLSIDTPVLTMISGRSDSRRTWDAEALMSADTVLDVEKLSKAAVKLGSHITLVRIDGGMHDLVLSPPAVRHVVFDEMGRWMDAYLR